MTIYEDGGCPDCHDSHEWEEYLREALDAVRAERDELKSWRVEAKRAMRIQTERESELEREAAALREALGRSIVSQADRIAELELLLDSARAERDKFAERAYAQQKLRQDMEREVEALRAALAGGEENHQ